MQIKDLDARQGLNVLFVESVVGFAITVVSIGWAVTAESRLDRFFAFSLLAVGVITILPTLIARGFRLASMMRTRS